MLVSQYHAMSEFDIILPTYNNLTELKACLEGCIRQSVHPFRVIVCVDGSTDGTLEYLSATRFSFECIIARHPDGLRHGRNATRNLALPFINSKFLLMLDSDTVPASDLLEKHFFCLKGKECVSIGMIQYINIDSNLWARYISSRGRYRFPHAAHLKYHLFNSGNAAFSSAYFKELGGQDAAMTHYGGGDTEFAIRLKDRYNPIFFNNREAIAFSEMNKNLVSALDQMVEFGQYSLNYLYAKHPAHRHIYSMNKMSKLRFIFKVLSPQCISLFIRKLIPYMPEFIQLAIVRYLAVVSIFHGFQRKGLATAER